MRRLRSVAASLIGTDRAWAWYYRLRRLARGRNTRYAIGMVTYVARYERYFQPVIDRFASWFPDTQIIVAVNGYHDQERQADYLSEVRRFLKRYRNVETIEHTHPQSLSKLWNEIIIKAHPDTVVIFNDDIMIQPFFHKELEASGALEHDVATLSRSWSHFVISKAVVARVGWFDERLSGVGNEDEDYEARLATAGETLGRVEVMGLKNFVHETRDFSYGKAIEVAKKKYVQANKVFFDRKWDLSPTPKPGYAWVEILQAYAKINDGMATPDFHPDARLQLTGGPSD